MEQIQTNKQLKQLTMLLLLMLSFAGSWAQTRINLSQSCGIGSSTLSVSSYQNYTGNGADGALTVSSATTINTVKTAVTGNNASGSTTINVSSTTGITAGSEILIITMQDNNTSGNLVGQYEFREVAAVTSTTITLYAGLTNTYNSSSTLKHQVIKVPNYTTVIVSNTLSCPSWDGSTGGVLVFRASSGVTVNAGGSISASGKGYRGTSHACTYRNQYGTQGEGIYGTGTTSNSANKNGGGGGAYDCSTCGSWWDGGGGGGGGYIAAGSTGTNSASATPGGPGGSSITNTNVTRAYLGGAGGEGGADEDGALPGAGGNGGGIIMIGASGLTLNNTSNIISNGAVGLNGDNSSCGAVGCGMAGGGGGAGGTIILQYATLTTSGTYTISATAGTGGTGSCANSGNGGTGSVGAIRIETSGTVATTSPAATSASLPTASYLWSNSSTGSTLSASTNGAYNVKLTYGNIVHYDTITVSMATPSVSVSASSSTVCAGTSVTFTASPVNGGTTPSYQWKVNGSNVGSNSATYTSTTLNNSDIVSCAMTSNASCISSANATSNSITMTVNTNLTPSNSISSSAGNTICAGTNVTFTATPVNGGNTPSFQWQKNGSSVGTNSSTYSSTTLAQNDIITCVLTSNAGCLTTTTSGSNSITMSVNANVTPSVSISASTSTTICSGTSVTFTATPVNGGTAPAYQWKKNGTNIGTSSTTYTYSSLANSDSITCVLTSNVACASSTTATSAAITMTVNTTVTPSVSISASSASAICSGTNVTFTAIGTNGGAAPAYQWKKNGTNVGTSSTTYSSSTLANNDVISCVLTSNAVCLTTTAATSNSITVSIVPTHWTGNVSNDWSNTGNWECGIEPSTGVDADIPASCTQFPVIGSGTHTCRHLTIHTGCSLTINSGAKLNIEGTFDHNGEVKGQGYICFHGTQPQTCKGNGKVAYCEHDNASGTSINSGDSLHITKCFKPTSGTFNTNNCLHFESDVNGTAQCLAGNYSNYISGEVICHNYIHGGRRAFRFLGNPHSNAIPLSQLTGDIDITGNGGAVNGFTGTNTNNPSAFWYDPTTGNGSSTNDPGWTAYTNTDGSGANAWKTGAGALVMIRGAKGEGLCCGSYVPSPVTIKTHGPINESNVQFNCTANNNLGYNFVANPYPCNIDLSQCSRGSNVGANFSVWDPNQGTQGAYVDQPFSFSYILPAYSAFITTCSANSNNSIVFHESDKNNSAASGNLFKTTTGFGNNVVQLRILSNNDSLSWDRLLLFFDGNAISNMDALDNQKIYNPGLSFYTYSTDNAQLSIDVRPYVSNQVIPLGLKNADTNNYSIRVDDYDVPAGAILYLHDKYLNQLLPLSSGIHYNFSVTSDPASQGDSRFELNLSDPTGIKNTLAPELTMSMYPNPGTDKTVVSFNAPATGKTNITISNIVGQELFRQNFGTMQTGKMTLPIHDLASGVYLVTLKCGDFTVTRRLVKQ